MDKQQILSFIQAQIAQGKITKEDLAAVASSEPAAQAGPSHAPSAAPVQTVGENSRNLINVFYAIGATIAIIGIAILIAEHWNEIGFGGRICVTLGISLVSYIAGLVFGRSEQRALSQVLFLISAVLAPLGTYVLLNEGGFGFDASMQITVSLVLAAIYGVAFWITRRSLLALVTVGFASWAYFAAVYKIFGIDLYSADFLKWATMLIGVAYLFIAYGYGSGTAQDVVEANEKAAVSNVLYGLGTLAILGAGITVGGGFDIVYIAFIFAAFYGSVYLKSRAMLVFGAVFLMAHIIKLTSKYFVGSVGWPVALIVVGFLTIGVGYLTFYVNKRYISQR